MFCGGRDKVPQGHIRPHYRDNGHLWAASPEDPTSIYCFKCKKEVSISFLDFKLMETKPEGGKMAMKKVIKKLEDVLSPPSDLMVSSPPVDQTMPHAPSCSEGGSHQVLGPLDTDLKVTPSPDIKTSADTNTEQLKVSPPGVTSKSAAAEEGLVITKARNIVKGLKNYGNTCYFNAVIQSLLALSSMRAIILRSDVQAGHLAMQLRELFLMTEASSRTAAELNIGRLLHAFLDINSQFADKKMQCSHDCFVSFRWSLHWEEVEEWKRAKDASIEDHITIPNFIFIGTQCSTVTGKVCKHSSPSGATPFGELLLSAPSKSLGDRDVVDGPISLDDCLKAYFGQVHIPKWECTECNSGRKETEPIVRVDADKRSCIMRAPIVLTISLGRTVDVDKKLYGHVSFPLVLDMSEFLHPRY